MNDGKSTPKVVLDSNVLVSAFITEGDSYEILKLGQAGKFTLYLAPGILEEVRRVLLEYEHIRKRYEYKSEEVKSYLDGLTQVAVMVTELPEVSVVEDDPDDDLILACAKRARADYVVSGDSHLKDLQNYRGIEILAPARFVSRLKS